MIWSRSWGCMMGLLAALAVGCDDDDTIDGRDAGADAGGTRDGGATELRATLMPTSAIIVDAGASTARGTVTFSQAGNMVSINISITDAPPGEHGIHIHMNGSCADTAADGSLTPAGAAGGHWNPAMMKHGQLGTTAMHHAGDLGNVTVAANRTGSKTLTTTAWTVSDLQGKSVVLHAAADDLMTDPTGNSGGRIACGVIAAP